MVGFGAFLMSDLDELLPPGSLLVVEEPDVVQARDIATRAAAHRCFAALVTAPIHDEDDLTAVLDSVPRPDGVCTVFPGVEYGVSAAAALADRWGLPGAGPTAARILRDKGALREAADRAGIPQPRWRRVTGAADVASFRDEFGGRCVLKPANRQGSLGVQLMEPSDDVAEAWALTTGVSEPRLRARRALPGTFLVEERLDGPEVSVECVVFKGQILFRNVTAKDVQPGRHPVEAGHRVPAVLPEETDEYLAALMTDLVVATGFGSGVLHAEWILRDGRRPHLVECAGRIPGDSIHELIDLAHGGSLVEDLLTVLSGSGEVTSRRPGRHAAIRFLDQPPGTVEAVSGVSAAAELPGVVRAHLADLVGRTLQAAASSQERVGYVLVTGASAEQARQRLDAAVSGISITTRQARDQEPERTGKDT
ncbi:ATP-grasp domain-containing protein [Streptomyces odontomachi]|uniref:ATP-grasp domain-containing protein n=1 Tax=Streptomyces odontomachi TaxID=2944940 RepID=UPI002108BA2E|nr:ATP-grasp domain-containing protein [Streptomyces sp. ODS25]